MSEAYDAEESHAALLEERCTEIRRERDELMDVLRDIARQLDCGVGHKLQSDVRPGHADYISKATAGRACNVLAKAARIALDKASS